MILLDHCVPRRFVRLLTEWGYTAELSTKHVAPDAPNQTIIELAQSRDAVLLTVDLDFGNILDYPPANYVGIIVLRYQADHENEIDACLKTALDDLYRDKLRQALVIVSPDRYRIRR